MIKTDFVRKDPIQCNFSIVDLVKGSLISKSFSVWLQNVPNTILSIFSLLRRIEHRRVIWHIFWEIGAKVKNILGFMFKVSHKKSCCICVEFLNFQVLRNFCLISSSCLCPVGCIIFVLEKKSNKDYVMFGNSEIQHL